MKHVENTHVRLLCVYFLSDWSGFDVFVKVGIVGEVHSAIKFILFFIVHGRVEVVFNGELNDSLEVCPEFVAVADAHASHVCEFMHSHVHQGVFVDEAAVRIFFAFIEAECEFLALIFTVGGVFTCGEDFLDFICVKFFNDALDHRVIGGVRLHMLDEFLEFVGYFGQKVRGFGDFGAFANTVGLLILIRDDTLELEVVGVLVHYVGDIADE